MEVWEECTEDLRTKNELHPENILISKVLSHCHYLRTNVAKCLGVRLGREDDGSKAGRGKIFVDLISQTERNVEVVQTARYYHYACVYNDVGLWLRNSTCYHYMLQNCVLEDGDCYGLKCRSEDDPTPVLKADDGKAKSAPDVVRLLWVYMLLTVMYY